MNEEDLYIGHDELLSFDEQEENNHCYGSLPFPDSPSWFITVLMDPCRTPDAEHRKAFEARSVALGFSRSRIAELVAFSEDPNLAPVQKRLLIKTLRSSMLRSLIPCPGASDLPSLASILLAEHDSGVPAPVPDWYTFSSVRFGPRQIGLRGCVADGCLNTEGMEKKFQKCGGCSLAHYCGKDCQLRDWKARHKKVCKKGSVSRKQMEVVSTMFAPGGRFGLETTEGEKEEDEREKERGGRRQLKKDAKARQKKAEQEEGL